ncbi:MAG: type II and III secretion system protein family protein [Gemmatimonadota bacterium]
MIVRKVHLLGSRLTATKRCMGVLSAVAAVFFMSSPLQAQTPTRQGLDPTAIIRVAVGGSHVVVHPVALRRVSVGNPEVADVLVVAGNEILVSGKGPGTTSLIFWDNSGGRELYTVRVTADAASLEEDLRLLFPDEDISVQASNGSVVLSGDIGDALVASKAMDIVKGTLGESASIIDNFSVPDPGQVLLQVRFAEVRRSVLEDLGISLIKMDPFNVRGETEVGTTTGSPGSLSGSLLGFDGPDQTLSQAVSLFFFSPDANVGAFIQALRQNGLFRSLAEPNLLAADGVEASFLAGGEFPFPVLQGGGTTNSVTIQFKEFGIQLRFTPTITTSGNIRLKVKPEVSALDFANGLQLSGFTVPALLTRRAETEIELADGQTFAIAGLVDNGMAETISKIPVLGDIPILGSLFRSKSMRQNRTELLVLVTPRLVMPADVSPEVPTGEPEGWDWTKSMRPETDENADTSEDQGVGQP